MSYPVIAFLFKPFLVFLVWAVMCVMNLWMFQKTKSKGNLFMTIGAGCLALSLLLFAFESYGEFQMFWLPFIGAILLVFGFYMTAKPVVDAHLEAITKKLHEATSEKKGAEPAGSEDDASDADKDA